jgi:hypothetical protein
MSCRRTTITAVAVVTNNAGQRKIAMNFIGRGKILWSNNNNSYFSNKYNTSSVTSPASFCLLCSDSIAIRSQKIMYADLKRQFSSSLSSPLDTKNLSTIQKRPFNSNSNSNRNSIKSSEAAATTTKNNNNWKKSQKFYQTTKYKQKQQQQELVLQLNKSIATAQTCNEILDLVYNTLKTTNDISSYSITTESNSTANRNIPLLDSVSYATAIQRIATLSKKQIQNKQQLLNDYRFAMLLSNLAESLVTLSSSTEQPSDRFRLRELSSVVWGIASMGIAQSFDNVPSLLLHYQPHDNNIDSSAANRMLSSANNVRHMIKMSKDYHLDTNVASIITAPTLWNPHHLVELTSQILDYIGLLIITSNKGNKNKSSDNPKRIRAHAYSNLLWGYAKTNRANGYVFDILVRNMIQHHKQEHLQMIDYNRIQERDNIKQGIVKNYSHILNLSQEWSLSIWAVRFLMLNNQKMA